MQTQADDCQKNAAINRFDPVTFAALFRNTLLSIEYESQKFTLYAERPSRWLRVIHKGCKVDSSAFITGYNPNKEEFHLHANLARQHWLRSKVGRQWPFLEGTGCNPMSGIDRGIPCPVEAQLLVLGISLEEALALGIEYGQPSVLYNEADCVPRFYHCESGECLSPPEDDQPTEIALGDIELDFRPATYWPSSLTPRQFIAQLPCTGLQQAALEKFEWGGLQALQEYIVQRQAKDSTDPCAYAARSALADFSFPPGDPVRTVVIATFSLRADNAEDVVITAEWDGEQICYDIRDEYWSQCQLGFSESERPLTLKQLVELIDGSNLPNSSNDGPGIVQSYWNAGFESEGSIEKALQFIAIKSSYYPQLAAYYAIASEGWVSSKLFQK